MEAQRVYIGVGMKIPDNAVLSMLRNGMNGDDVNRVFAEGGQDAVDALPWERLPKAMIDEMVKAGGGSEV